MAITERQRLIAEIAAHIMNGELSALPRAGIEWYWEENLHLESVKKAEEVLQEIENETS